MADRKARTWEKVVPGWEYVVDSFALPWFCACGRSDGCHCDYRWDKFKLIGSEVFLIGVYVNIKRVHHRLCGLCYMGTS